MLKPKVDPLVETPTGLYEREHVINRLDRLIDRFHQKGNSRGLDIAIEAFDEARYRDRLSDGKWAWIEKNIKMHRLPPLSPWSVSLVRVPDDDMVYEVLRPEDLPRLAVTTETAVTTEINRLVDEVYTLLGGVVDKLEELRRLQG